MSREGAGFGLAGRFLARPGIKFSSAKWRFGRKIQSAAGLPGDVRPRPRTGPAEVAIPSIRPPEMHLSVRGFPRSLKTAGSGLFRHGLDPIRAYLLRMAS